MKCFQVIIALSSIFLTSLINPLIGENRVALVVGVSNYEYTSQLKNTLNDANDIAKKLELLGFEVIKLLDPKLKTINNYIDSIGSRMSKIDVLLFYFSGHGAEYNGENYLFLKDSNPKVPNDMPYETYPIGKLIGKIEFNKVKTNILILDACRSNPFTRYWTRNTNQFKGLANINAPTGTFIGFAASPGKTASDGAGRNGTYSEAILEFIEIKNMTIDQLFTKINKEVRIKSEGKQIPFKNSSLEDDFYFNRESLTNFSKSEFTLNSSTKYVIAEVNRPKFPLPKIITGYRSEGINSYAIATLNKTEFSKNEIIEICINLIGNNIWDKATPIYVELVNRIRPTSVYHIYGEEFQAVGKLTQINLSSSLEPGNYELTVGFYLVDEINQEYPPFYSKKFNITIH